MTGRWSAGTVVHLGREASPQFGGDRAMRVRIISVSDRPTYAGWVWLTGYVLAANGAATDKRELYVIADGVQVLSRPTVSAVGRPATAQPTDRTRPGQPVGPNGRRRPARTLG